VLHLFEDCNLAFSMQAFLRTARVTAVRAVPLQRGLDGSALKSALRHLPLVAHPTLHTYTGRGSTATMQAEGSRVVGREVLKEAKFLRFVNLSYVREPDTSHVHSWQSVERTTTDQTLGIDGG
jgi:hypothetical protein